jgi:hypothetical protein
VKKRQEPEALNRNSDPLEVLMRERVQHAIELTVEQELEEVLGAASSARFGSQRADYRPVIRC